MHTPSEIQCIIIHLLISNFCHHKNNHYYAIVSVFWQTSNTDKTTSVMFRVLAFADTFALFLGPFQDFVNRVAYSGGIENTHNVVCKVKKQTIY